MVKQKTGLGANQGMRRSPTKANVLKKLVSNNGDS
jgi:hypothetical protein